MTDIEVTGLTKRYGNTTAVNDLSFVVRPGQVTGFLGPNGAGKSTTMRLILGLARADVGSATIGGATFRSIHRPLHTVGAVLEVRAVHGGRSAYAHLLCLAQSNGIPRHRVGEVLDLVGLTDVAGRRAHAFSLGMAQRLGLAAALLGDPPVLMCDEPINGLDPEGILWIRTLLRGLAAEGRTVFVSSHGMSEMALTADHLIIVGRGRLIADAPTGEVLAASSVNYVLVSSPQPEQLAAALTAHGGQVRSEDGSLHVRQLDRRRIGEIAAAHQLTLYELTDHQASLETAFMELTHDSTEFRAATATS
jgi:ABC-2 type transport system ATP-binding protein